MVSPFAVLLLLGLWRELAHHPSIQWSHTGSAGTLSTAILVAMWNYMGWDNVSTIAQEVDHPQRNYPRAMIVTTVITAVSYILPLAAIGAAGLPVSSFATGDWSTAAAALGGRVLGLAIVAGGCITGIGMFNALVMSYTRLPMVMAEDRMLPRALTRRNRYGAPWVSILVCGLAWALALKLPFERLISMDLILYGSSLLLEFVALVVLRLREPELPRPFRAGNFAFACLLGVCPALLILYALWASRGEVVLGRIPALVFAFAVALLGPLLYWLTSTLRPAHGTAVASMIQEADELPNAVSPAVSADSSASPLHGSATPVTD